jgi:hypothetical protein
VEAGGHTRDEGHICGQHCGLFYTPGLSHTVEQGERHRRRRARKLRRRAAAIGVLGAVFIAGAAPARAGARATINPSSYLSDGSVVSVTWSGVPAGERVNVFQCAQPPSTRTCAINAGLMNLASDAFGGGRTNLAVHTGPQGPSGAQCPGAGNDCIVVINIDGKEDPGSNYILPISFGGSPPPGATRDQLALTGPSRQLGLALTGGGAMVAGLVLVKLVEVPANRPAPLPRRTWRRADDDIIFRRRKYKPKHLRKR